VTPAPYLQRVDEKVSASRPVEGIDLKRLEHSLRRPRTLFSWVASGLVTFFTLLALVPLASVLWMVVTKGSRNLRWSLFTELPPVPLEVGGGFGNAILGTLVIVGLASLVTLPLGILSGVFLARAPFGSRVASLTRFAAQVLTGFPSILAGVFAYGAIVRAAGGFSAIAGAVGLSVLMLPTITLTTEDALRMVPSKMIEAGIGMGATSAQLISWIMLPTALPAIMTGSMLALARAAGETAPLLFTALFSHYWLAAHGHVDLMQPTASLAVLIYNFAGAPYENQVEMAWSAALVLLVLVLLANIASRLVSRRQQLS
jgi:phosphate transport system permease protein